MNYIVDVESIKADLRVLLDSRPNVNGCWLCGNRSVCHNCHPENAARARLKAFAGLK